jgi:hypothetical protein
MSDERANLEREYTLILNYLSSWYKTGKRNPAILECVRSEITEWLQTLSIWQMGELYEAAAGETPGLKVLDKEQFYRCLNGQITPKGDPMPRPHIPLWKKHLKQKEQQAAVAASPPPHPPSPREMSEEEKMVMRRRLQDQFLAQERAVEMFALFDQQGTLLAEFLVSDDWPLDKVLDFAEKTYGSYNYLIRASVYDRVTQEVMSMEQVKIVYKPVATFKDREWLPRADK